MNEQLNKFMRNGELKNSNDTKLYIRLIPKRSKHKDNGDYKTHKYLAYLDPLYAYFVFLPLRLESEIFLAEVSRKTEK